MTTFGDKCPQSCSKNVHPRPPDNPTKGVLWLSKMVSQNSSAATTVVAGERQLCAVAAASLSRSLSVSLSLSLPLPACPILASPGGRRRMGERALFRAKINGYVSRIQQVNLGKIWQLSLYTSILVTLGRCPLSIFCSRGTPPKSGEPTNPESINPSEAEPTVISCAALLNYSG